MTVLIACAHGTRDPDGQATIREVVAAVRQTLPELEVREAYVDVHGPDLVDVIADVPVADEGCAAVVVPLLLAGGYHVYHDIAGAVADRPDVVATPALGPDGRLIDLVMERLAEAEAEAPQEAVVVLAAAGSSDPRSQADTDTAAELLAARWSGPVLVGFAAGVRPSVAEAVASAHERYPGRPVAVASFLLAPGHFQKRLAESGADVVTRPLAPSQTIVEIVVDRFREALATPDSRG